MLQAVQTAQGKKYGGPPIVSRQGHSPLLRGSIKDIRPFSVVAVALQPCLVKAGIKMAGTEACPTGAFAPFSAVV